MKFKYQLGFIGAGNMAKAISQGIIKSKILNANDMIMSATKNGSYNGIEILNNNKYVVDNCKYLILAVKPQVFESIANEIKDLKNELIISIMAGKSSNKIQKSLNTKAPIVRIMPNTPCMLGEGMSVISNNSASKEQNMFVYNIFKSIGEVEYIDENLFDAVTSVSGSGPAYVYYFIKSMTDGGIANGLTYEKSLTLTLQTFLGSIKMIQNNNETIDKLIEKVCSKGGTTIEAINTFKNNKLDEIIKQGMLNCKKRSEELSK